MRPRLVPAQLMQQPVRLNSPLASVALFAALILTSLLFGLASGILPLKLMALAILFGVAGLAALALLMRPVGLGVVLALPMLVPALPSPTGLPISLQTGIIVAILAAIWWATGAGRPVIPWWAIAGTTLLAAWSLAACFAGRLSLLDSITWLIVWNTGIVLGAGLAKQPSALYGLVPIFVIASLVAMGEAAGLGNPWADATGADYFAPIAGIPGAQRSISTFGQPLIAGAMLAAAALLFARGRRPVLIATSLLCIAGSLATVSRSAMVGLVAGGLVLLWIERARARTVVPYLAAAVVAAVLAVSFVPTINASFNARVTNNSESQRIREYAFDVTRARLRSEPQSVAFGGGVGSATRRLTARGGVYGFYVFDNQYATAIFDFGIVPLLLALGCFAIAIRFGARSSRRLAAPSLVAVAVALAFTDGGYWVSLSLMATMLLGLASSGAPASEARRRPEAQRSRAASQRRTTAAMASSRSA